MLTPELLKVLTPSAVLLLLVLLMARAWIKDRNARIEDLKQQLNLQWEVYKESERAREKSSEITKLALEQARTQEAIIEGLRSALALKNGD